MITVISAATPADVQVCNALQPPQAGAQAGGGLHIVIPPNFAALIAQGQEVPGCTYAHVEVDGSLIVTDWVQAQLAVPAVVSALPLAQKTGAPLLVTKLATAVSAQLGQAQQQVTDLS